MSATDLGAALIDDLQKRRSVILITRDGNGWVEFHFEHDVENRFGPVVAKRIGHVVSLLVSQREVEGRVVGHGDARLDHHPQARHSLRVGPLRADLHKTQPAHRFAHRGQVVVEAIRSSVVFEVKVMDQHVHPYETLRRLAERGRGSVHNVTERHGPRKRHEVRGAANMR